ncbi:SCO1/SenC-domain-containing protein [Podospora aff. communis PSN243]|uniref:SCO1/SenC-domain-containing protein n=1 Tax=Podospora aff. communis PSN243 TaxID=3040156 RepID=A0AAV9GZZ1_9PEZI|nr:SCO1/SenC-domain-containing protein [Podospora aff. communis PSN243]
MPQPAAPMRTVINALSRAPARQCARSMSTTRGSQHSRRPATQCLPQVQLRQPLVQRRTFKTVEEAKSRYRSGPFSWKAGILFVLTGGGLLYYFEREKERMQAKRIAESQKGVGAPKVGGPFQLINQDGKTVTEQDLKGRYSLVYFGFTHCPDICPEELDKMARMFDVVQAERPDGLLPVFVTCDPARDGPKELKEYLAEFHPAFIGLTGTYDQIKAMCKAYRVYFSTPSQVKPGQDYLVDHSIYFYLMDPEGDFVEALGRQHSPDQAAKIILGHMKEWKGVLKKN